MSSVNSFLICLEEVKLLELHYFFLSIAMKKWFQIINYDPHWQDVFIKFEINHITAGWEVNVSKIKVIMHFTTSIRAGSKWLSVSFHPLKWCLTQHNLPTPISSFGLVLYYTKWMCYMFLLGWGIDHINQPSYLTWGAVKIDYSYIAFW